MALVVSNGDSRLADFQSLADILRRMEIRGANVQLNKDFHYGLLFWLMGNDAMCKPNTRFVVSYLALRRVFSALAKSKGVGAKPAPRVHDV